MPDGREPVTARLVARIADIGAARWDACAGPHNPFVSYAFLSALEDSGSCTAKTGWQPQHLVVENAAGGIVAVAPMYLKAHSYGEYVFDNGWANAFQRAGGQYYPKLQVAVPFSPVTGPRLLVSPAVDRAFGEAALIQAFVQATRELEVSSLHVTFLPETECARLEAAGFLVRHGEQFHWKNEGYETFDDFLASLVSRKRKMIRRERRIAAETGVKVKALMGDDIKSRHWDAFYRFYLDTVERKWAHAYLTREFFHLLGERMGDKVVLMTGEDDGELVAGALNLRSTDTLFGRNWGCGRDYPMLHFEMCYYRAIEYAIENRLAWVEAGAQGPHKIQRGYLPRRTYSAHWIENLSFRRAVAQYLEHERPMVEREMEELEEFSPFREKK